MTCPVESTARDLSPRSTPTTEPGRAGAGSWRSISTENEQNHRPARCDTVAERIRAVPRSTCRASFRVDSCVRTVPIRASVTCRRSPASPNAPVVNRHESPPRLPLNLANPSFGPWRLPVRLSSQFVNAVARFQTRRARLVAVLAPPRRHHALGPVPVLAQGEGRPALRRSEPVGGEAGGLLSFALLQVRLDLARPQLNANRCPPQCDRRSVPAPGWDRARTGTPAPPCSSGRLCCCHRSIRALTGRTAAVPAAHLDLSTWISSRPGRSSTTIRRPIRGERGFPMVDTEPPHSVTVPHHAVPHLWVREEFPKLDQGAVEPRPDPGDGRVQGTTALTALLRDPPSPPFETIAPVSGPDPAIRHGRTDRPCARPHHNRPGRNLTGRHRQRARREPVQHHPVRDTLAARPPSRRASHRCAAPRRRAPSSTPAASSTPTTSGDSPVRARARPAAPRRAPPLSAAPISTVTSPPQNSRRAGAASTPEWKADTGTACRGRARSAHRDFPRLFPLCDTGNTRTRQLA
jgi:hypothetical protein